VAKRRTGKRIISELIDPLCDAIRHLPENDLHALSRHCNSLTTTNCGWTAFALGPTILELADSEVLIRQSGRRQARKEAKRS